MAGQSATKFDVSGITETIQRALSAAGLDTHSGPMKGVTETINQALTAAGLMQRVETPAHKGSTIEGTAYEIAASLPSAAALTPPPFVDGDDDAVAPVSDIGIARPAQFLSRSFASANGTRLYRLYVPGSHADSPSERMPMVVMLHGCTQSPDDFAAGTRMNALAEEHGFLVVYPAQSANANGSKCWNWFRSEDQIRDSGEPAIIAGITREVASTYPVDKRRIFVAGLSAGAAMAVILGATYPDLYAAVGAHSGLPYGAAHDMASAFGAMHAGSVPGPIHSSTGRESARPATDVVPTIVFHGDGDHTVNACNGAAIVEQATRPRPDQPALRASVQEGTAPGGRSYTRTTYVDAGNRVVAEQWLLHGAGHAWSGGSTAGSFTDARGPDASEEMIRFFLSQPRPGTA